MIRVCFKLIGNVFQIPTAIQLANNQIKALLQYIDQFMFVSDHIGDVIDCLNVSLYYNPLLIIIIRQWYKRRLSDLKYMT